MSGVLQRVEMGLGLGKKSLYNYFRNLQKTMHNETSSNPILAEVEEEESNLGSGEQIQEGRWAQDEHDRFLIGEVIFYSGIMQFGKDWREVEKVVKTRTGSQVRSHSQKYFIKLKKIRKERKKQKSKLPAQPTELEQEVIGRFTE